MFSLKVFKFITASTKSACYFFGFLLTVSLPLNADDNYKHLITMNDDLLNDMTHQIQGLRESYLKWLLRNDLKGFIIKGRNVSAEDISALQNCFSKLEIHADSDSRYRYIPPTCSVPAYMVGFIAFAGDVEICGFVNINTGYCSFCYEGIRFSLILDLVARENFRELMQKYHN